MMKDALTIISAESVEKCFEANIDDLMELIKKTYLLHDAGLTVNPASQFLRFPDKPDARIISLPASILDGARATGMKWIASFPSNRSLGIPRASAILTLNDPETGVPYAVLEGSAISAMRTSLSAVAAAESLCPAAVSASVGFVGAGRISETVFRVLRSRGRIGGKVTVFDSLDSAMDRFVESCASAGFVARKSRSIEELVCSCDLIVVATTALEPHIGNFSWFNHSPTVLHLSLRDLKPEIVIRSQNFVDDASHAFSARTSLELAEREAESRKFLTGTLGDLLSKRFEVSFYLPRIFSPFGLGILDVALGRSVYERCIELGESIQVEKFFSWNNV